MSGNDGCTCWAIIYFKGSTTAVVALNSGEVVLVDVLTSEGTFCFILKLCKVVLISPRTVIQTITTPVLDLSFCQVTGELAILHSEIDLSVYSPCPRKVNHAPLFCWKVKSTFVCEEMGVCVFYYVS